MRHYLLVAGLFSALVFGCQKGGGVKVSGRVTKDGQPLPKAQVIFECLGADGKPDPDKEAGGETDDNGQYVLKRVKGAHQLDGAVAGDYRVEIHLVELSKEVNGRRELIPPRYNKNSELKFTVPPDGTDQANFDVKSK